MAIFVIHYIDTNGEEWLLEKYSYADAEDELADFIAVFGGWGYVECV